MYNHKFFPLQTLSFFERMNYLDLELSKYIHLKNALKHINIYWRNDKFE